MKEHTALRAKKKLALAIGLIGVALPLAPSLSANDYGSCTGCGDWGGTYMWIGSCLMINQATICSTGVCTFAEFVCQGGQPDSSTFCTC